MSLNKEAELIKSIVVFFHRCEEEGDYDALYEMGFGPSEIRALSSLSSADTLRLASMKSHFLTIKLNCKIYWRMIDYILKERAKEGVINELIRCDAPPKLMYSLAGISNKQFRIKRIQMGLPALAIPSGRPPQPTVEVEKTVWKAVEKTLQNSTSLGPQEFLDIFNSLKREVSLRTIWILIQEWESDGSLK